jgi:hypothetical protein
MGEHQSNSSLLKAIASYRLRSVSVYCDLFGRENLIHYSSRLIDSTNQFRAHAEQSVIKLKRSLKHSKHAFSTIADACSIRKRNATSLGPVSK